jgi:demethylspheroidene O-methyltransferase
VWLGQTMRLSHRFSALRDRLVSNPRFQAFAERFPLTRPVARRRARALFDLCSGFVYSQVLFACVKLGLFPLLARAPLPRDEIARALDLSPEATQRLLDAAVSLELVERRGGDEYGLGGLGAALIGNPAVVAMIEHHHLLYADLADPVALLRGEAGEGALARYWAYAGAASPSEVSDAQVTSYTDLMAASQPMVARQVISSYNLKRHRRLMDVGGGSGAFLAAVAREVPGLELALFDLPAVAEQARGRFAREGLSDRTTVHGGSFFDDPLPEGADIISLVRIVHDHDDGPVLALLRAVRRALPTGGILLLAEPMAGTPGAESVADAYFGFYLLAMGSGRARTPEELAKLLEKSGFGPPRLLSTPMPLITRLLISKAI